jgi:hypothetical protein
MIASGIVQKLNAQMNQSLYLKFVSSAQPEVQRE